MRPIRALPGHNRGARLDSGGPGARHEQGFVKAWLETGAFMPQDGIYRAILWVLALTVVAGALFAILGETAAHDPVMVRVGAGVALVAGAIYAFFRRLGAKKNKPRGDSDE
jgi:nitrate reductase gamma subunit